MRSVKKKVRSARDRPLGSALIIDINFFVVHNICITLKLSIGTARLEASGRLQGAMAAYTL